MSNVIYLGPRVPNNLSTHLGPAGKAATIEHYETLKKNHISEYNRLTGLQEEILAMCEDFVTSS